MSEVFRHWAFGPFSHDEIRSGGETYLRRFQFCTRKLSIKLHEFVRGDIDRALHSHPWRWWFTIPLTTGYMEETENGLQFVRRWRIHWRKAHKHRVVAPDNSCRCWTLIVCGPLERPWGFYLLDADGKEQFIPWEEWGGDEAEKYHGKPDAG